MQPRARGIESLISFSLFSVVPKLLEMALVLTILAVKLDAWFAWITLGALVLYIAFTVLVTEWRTKFRREANEFDSAAHSKVIDSLLIYQTVTYFKYEGFEAKSYDESLERLKSQTRASMPFVAEALRPHADSVVCYVSDSTFGIPRLISFRM